ncbi:unnamed protein product [Blepharisma stoltei]|uniref:Uncharacterized protein n=1 Tax=Blepharisma stoltei TaxID=1481888 RepID=A0AAU9I956_9CILI|nr:unnamed protein product [Blepharisma stoltei]
MESLPLLDLQTREPLDFALPENTFCLLIFFEIKQFQAIKEIYKEIKDNSMQPLGVFLGDSIINVTTWAKKESKLMKVYSASSISDWQKFGVEKTPWILVLRNMEVILSASMNEIHKPFMINLKKKLGIEPGSPGKSSNSLSDIGGSVIGPDSSPSRFGEVAKLVQQKPTLEALCLRLENMEKVSAKNQEDISILKESLAEKDKILKEIIEKLNSFQGTVKLRKPLVKYDIKKTTESGNDWNKQDSVSNASSDLCKDLWIYSIGSEQESLPAIANPETLREEYRRDIKSVSPVRKSLQMNRRKLSQSTKNDSRPYLQYGKRF